jgi:hypothetical protein
MTDTWEPTQHAIDETISAMELDYIEQERQDRLRNMQEFNRAWTVLSLVGTVAFTVACWYGIVKLFAWLVQ